MKIYTFHKSLALILALVMLTTSVSFAADLHFCQGQLKSFSLTGKAKNCHELAKKVKSCKHHAIVVDKPACNEDTGNCCSNKMVEFDLEQNQQVQNLSIEISKPSSLLDASFIAVQINIRDIAENQNQTRFALLKPPLIPKDIRVLFQSFLL